MSREANQSEHTIPQPVQQLNEELKKISISSSLAENVQILKCLFEKDDTFLIREVQNQKDPAQQYVVAYCAGMIDNAFVGDNIIRPLTHTQLLNIEKNHLDAVARQLLWVHNPSCAENYQEVVEAVTYGDSVLFLPGEEKALVLSTQGFPVRGVSEPEGEITLSGSKEGFGESLILNLSFLHRRLRTNDLKMEMRSFGTRSRTQACICYLDSLVNRPALEELQRRLDSIEIDGVLDANYLNELIRDNPMSPFRSTGYTERPDIVAGKLLEGRIAIVLDGTPVVLTIPYLFIENFQSNEDYYLSFYYTSFSRMLRIFGFLLSILTPSLYLVVTTYHHELLPTPLLMNIANERLNVPFPMVLELLIMLLMFDILRETGVRMSSGVGQAMSVVGALVLGSAAVEAKLVSSLVIIMVALTGITSLLVPKLNAATLMTRIFLYVFAAFGGFPGLTMGCAFLLIHLLHLKSFGLWQISITGNLQFQQCKDILFRAPLWTMQQRPITASAQGTRLSKPKRR